MKYTDPALTIDEQIEYLRSSHLTIDNEGEIRNILMITGYFRLNNYMKYFKTDKKFTKNIRIADIIALYELDKRLRISLFDAIADIEVAIKALMNNTLACKYGSHWITDPTIFKPEFSGNHQTLVTDITAYCSNNPEEQFIKRYKLNYDEPRLPPSWMIMEVLSLGKISRIYDAILGTEDRVNISLFLKTHDNILTSWLHCLTYIRNLCAHHGKILDRTLTIKPIMPSRKKNRFLNDIDELDVSKIYSVLCCIQYLLRTIKPNGGFKNSIVNLIHGHPDIKPDILGFTKNWDKEQIWQ